MASLMPMAPSIRAAGTASIDRLIARAERELRTRQRLHPGLLAKGRMSITVFRHEMQEMETVLDTLRWLTDEHAPEQYPWEAEHE